MSRRIHPGQRSDALFRRNADLTADYLSGKFTMVQLVVKYKISAVRIYELLNRSGAVEKRKNEE